MYFKLDDNLERFKSNDQAYDEPYNLKSLY